MEASPVKLISGFGICPQKAQNACPTHTEGAAEHLSAFSQLASRHLVGNDFQNLWICRQTDLEPDVASPHKAESSATGAQQVWSRQLSGQHGMTCPSSLLNLRGIAHRSRDSLTACATAAVVQAERRGMSRNQMLVCTGIAIVRANRGAGIITVHQVLCWVAPQETATSS